MRYLWGIVIGVVLAVGGAGTAGAQTATCNDSWTSYSQHRSGTCSWHGGVSTWGHDPSYYTTSAWLADNAMSRTNGPGYSTSSAYRYSDALPSTAYVGSGGTPTNGMGGSLVPQLGGLGGSVGPAWVSGQLLNFGPGDDGWHPASYYGPQVAQVPGRGVIADDGSVFWLYRPDAASGR
jgi:hypothetical protein